MMHQTSLLCLVALIWGATLALQADAQVNEADPLGGCDSTLPLEGQCGGRGTCDPSTKTCSCFDLWSKNADFIDSEDCPTSIIAMYVLWAVNIAEIMWVLYSTSYVLVARAENFFEQKKLKKDYTLWKNKGLIALLIYFGIGLPSHLAMAILHMVNPITRVGFDILPTLLFFFGKVGLYGASVFLQGPLIAAVLKGQAEFVKVIKTNYILNMCVSTSSIIVGSFAFITYDYLQSNFTAQVAMMRAYYLVQAATLLVNGLQALLIQRWVFGALESARALVSSQDNKTESIKRKVGDLQGQIIKQGIIQGLIYVIMGAVPFFLNKHAYFLPLSWLAMPIIGKRLAFQFDLDKAGARSLAQRFRKDKKTSTYENSATGSKKKKEGDNSFNPEPTQTENPTFAFENPGSSFHESEIATSPTKKGSKQKKGQVLSVAVSDEEGGMNEIMSDEKGPLRERFTQFVRKKHAPEAIMLYDACYKYSAVVKSTSGDKQKEKLKKLGKGIVDMHVRENSQYPVDMPDDMRKAILEAAQNDNFGPTTFDALRSMAFDLLKSNFYREFAKTLN